MVLGKNAVVLDKGMLPKFGPWRRAVKSPEKDKKKSPPPSPSHDFCCLLSFANVIFY